jgi:hypothetical protein
MRADLMSTPKQMLNWVELRFWRFANPWMSTSEFAKKLIVGFSSEKERIMLFAQYGKYFLIGCAGVGLGIGIGYFIGLFI